MDMSVSQGVPTSEKLQMLSSWIQTQDPRAGYDLVRLTVEPATNKEDTLVRTYRPPSEVTAMDHVTQA